jgi:hypothetical protein
VLGYSGHAPIGSAESNSKAAGWLSQFACGRASVRAINEAAQFKVPLGRRGNQLADPSAAIYGRLTPWSSDISI